MPTPTIRVSQLPAIGTPDDPNLVLVSILSSTVTITATTISAQASDNSFNDSGNGFGIFADDDQVQVTGFTGDTANNIYSATITEATAGKIVIGGADGDVIVDDAAGESVTITKWESVRMTLAELATYMAATGGGTVTSVALSAPAEFTVSGSPVTGSGTLTFAKANQNANLVYAGPSTGAAAAPTFRSLVAEDLPSGTTLWDAHAFYPDVPTASAIILRIPSARAVNFAANFAGSYAVASVAATASTAFDVQKNGSTIGTITFAISATTGTFTTSGGAAQTLAAGDVLSIIAPVTPDATLANVGFALAGTR